MTRETNIAEIREKGFINMSPFLDAMAIEYLAMAGVPNEEIQGFLGNRFNYDTWNPKYVDETGIGHGMDIWDAIRCLVDTVRTETLLKGLSETTKSLKQQKPHLVAIDAGTGTGILSMALIAYGFDKVYSLEINPQTAKNTRNFLESKGLSEKIEVIECDATRVDLNGLKANMLVSENLANGLLDEPQYSIIHHLSRFLEYDAKIIPARADLFVQLGSSSWEGYKMQDGVAHLGARKLKDLQRLSAYHKYAGYNSTVGLNLKIVRGHTIVDHRNSPVSANTLIIGTRFQINDLGTPYFLEPDTAEFLGKSAAFKLDAEIPQGFVPVELKYRTGMRRKFSRVSVNNGSIKFWGSK